jgi:hypothetical protein
MAKTLTFGPIGSPPDTARPTYRTERQRVFLLGLFCLAAYVAIALSSALITPFPNHIDELAHLSYVVTIAQHGIAGFDLGAMRMLSATLTSFTTKADYLPHPPMYYLMLSWLLPAGGWPTLASVYAMRLANLALSSLAVGCALGVGLVRRFERPVFMLYALMVIVSPNLWSIGGAINNDNLAILGGSAAFLGAQLLANDRGSRSGQIALVAGCTLAMLAKLTSGVMVDGFAVIFLLLQWRDVGRGPSRRFVVVLAAFVTLASMPFLYFLAKYGSAVPITPGFVSEYRRVAELFAAHPDAVVNGWRSGEQLSFIGYASQFAWWLLTDWNPIFGTGSLLNLAVLVVPVALLALTALAWFGNLRRGHDQDIVILAAGLALIAVLPLHLLFSYRMYREVGSPPFDAFPRYYLPLALSLIPAAVCWLVVRARERLQVMFIRALAISLALVPIAMLAK